MGSPWNPFRELVLNLSIRIEHGPTHRFSSAIRYDVTEPPVFFRTRLSNAFPGDSAIPWIRKILRNGNGLFLSKRAACFIKVCTNEKSDAVSISTTVPPPTRTRCRYFRLRFHRTCSKFVGRGPCVRRTFNSRSGVLSFHE